MSPAEGRAARPDPIRARRAAPRRV